jgi:nickel superoxide dismutase
MRVIVSALVMAGVMVSTSKTVQAHCEVPCGIYTDGMRVQMIREDGETIRKAMTQIEALSKAETVNYNQIVRWTTTKEDHANKIQDIVYQYFMTQRIIPVKLGTDSGASNKYVHELTLLHGILVQAMKCKQTTDTANVDELLEKLAAFEASYFGKPATEHLNKHH